MRINTAPLLKHRGVFASRDPNETRAFMLTKEFELDLAPRDKDAFDFAASAAYLPNSYLGFVRYGAPARVRVPADRKRDDYFIHFSGAGHR